MTVTDDYLAQQRGFYELGLPPSKHTSCAWTWLASTTLGIKEGEHVIATVFGRRSVHWPSASGTEPEIILRHTSADFRDAKRTPGRDIRPVIAQSCNAVGTSVSRCAAVVNPFCHQARRCAAVFDVATGKLNEGTQRPSRRFEMPLAFGSRRMRLRYRQRKGSLVIRWQP